MGTGLSKKDPNSPEQKYNTFTGLYPECLWDPRVVKKMVLDRKLAPMYPGCDSGADTPENLEKLLEECPICMLFYPSLNRSNCCRQGICTECFLQIKSSTTAIVNCPFCNRSKYQVNYLGPLSKEEKVRELEEQQKVTELQIKLQIEQERERAMSLPTNFDRAKELQQEEIRNSRRESMSPSTSLTTQSTGLFDQFSHSAPAVNNNNPPLVPGGRGTQSRTSTSSSAAEEAPFYDDWGLAEEDLDEILLREAIQLSLQTSAAANPQQSTTTSTLLPPLSGGPGRRSNPSSQIGGAAG